MAENDNTAPEAENQQQPAAPQEGAPSGAPVADVVEGTATAGAASAAPKKPELSEKEKLLKQQQREERLRQWREEQEALRNPPSGTAKIFRAIDGAVQGVRSKIASGDSGENSDSTARVAEMAAAKRSRRLLWGSIPVVMIIILAVYLVPIVPLQVKRSAGFAAFQAGDYPEALSELQEYLIERPTDLDALYLAARAAMFSGDPIYAEQSIKTVQAAGGLPDSVAGYYYALFNFDKPEEALRAVEHALNEVPQHLASRLLRGILLGQQQGKDREAREDFLQASEIVRNSDELEAEDVRVMHDYFQKRGYLSLSLELPPINADIHSRVSRQLGFLPGLDGFVYRLQYSRAGALGEETLNAESTINYYFVDMLLRHNEVQEAGSVLESLQRGADDSLIVAQLSGFYAVASGDVADAQARFERMLEELPDDPITINNLATVELLSIGEGEGAMDHLRGVAATYRRLLELDFASVTEFVNGAYIALLSNDIPTAQNLLDGAAAESAAGGGWQPAAAGAPDARAAGDAGWRDGRCHPGVCRSRRGRHPRREPLSAGGV